MPFLLTFLSHSFKICVVSMCFQNAQNVLAEYCVYIIYTYINTYGCLCSKTSYRKEYLKTNPRAQPKKDSMRSESRMVWGRRGAFVHMAMLPERRDRAERGDRMQHPTWAVLTTPPPSPHGRRSGLCEPSHTGGA